MARGRLTLAVVAVLAAVSCTRSSTPEKPSGRASEVLRLVEPAAPLTLDPQRHDEDLTRATLANYYESLVETDATLAVRPKLALSWSNPSETVWRFHLRPGVQFHDGGALGPADVERTISRGRALGATGVPADVRSIVEVRAVDERTVELVTDRPRPLLLVNLAQVSILPRHAPDDEIRQPIGTGPYRFEPPHSGRRFERYWGPPPAFASFIIEVARDEAARRKAIEGGAHLVHPFGGPVPESHRLKRHETATVSYLLCRVAPLRGGLRSPVADVRVRQAIDLLLDRRALVDGAVPGEAVPVDQLVTRGIQGFDPSLPPRTRDPARARSLLAEAGLAGGFSAGLLTSERGAAAGRELARQLAAIGISLSVEPLPWPDLYRRLLDGSSPLALVSWTMTTGDSSSLFEPVLHSRGDPARSGRDGGAGTQGFGSENTSGYRNPALDELIDRAAREMRVESRAHLQRQAMRLALADLPLIPLYAPVWGYAVRRDLTFSPRLDLWVRAADVGLVTTH